MPTINKLNLTSCIALIKSYLLDLQNNFCQMLEVENGQAKFISDPWQHKDGGGGITRVLAGGNIIEKAGVNFSHVQGKQLPQAATAKRPDFIDASFQALGVSIVVHPRNPYAPTMHANLRFIVVEKGESVHWWFGGGFDLTPYYGFIEDCQHWHRTAQQACEPFGQDIYPKYKKWCDDYFYLKHRNEPRGIGGLFFDDLNHWEFTRCFDFMKSIGDHLIPAYQPILARRKNISFSQPERDFQAYRRGRYVEFNLLYDRGTLFGIQSGGRTESILMSLPPSVTWHYDWQPQAGTKEAELYEIYLPPREWI